MKLSEFRNHLDHLSQLNLILPNGVFIPRHFHITEVGLTTKHFIDCGGTVRTDKSINLQVWVAEDFNHRLEPNKLQKIISLSENLFEPEDLEVEIEFQSTFSTPTINSHATWQTIGRYGVELEGENFMLTTKQTDCLAKDHCGIPATKENLELSSLQTQKNACCTPGGGCC